MALIVEIIINLKASTASFVTDLERVKNLSFSTATQIQRSFQLIGTAALGMVSTFAASALAMTEKTVEFEVHILHLAASAGMSVEAMSGLAFAARMYGMEIDKVASGMEKFDKQLIAAQLGNKKATQNMSLLGIDPASVKTTDEALMKLADHFQKMPDGILKTGEAMLAFNKNGAVMIPVLNLGSEGIRKLLDLARALGLVFSKEDAEAALLFKQNITILEGEFEGFRIQLEKAILPNLNALVDVLISTKKETQNAGTTIDVLKFSFQVVASAIVLTIEAAKTFGSQIREIAEEAFLDGKGIVDVFKAIGLAASGNIAGANKAMESFHDQMALAALAAGDGAKREIDIGAEAWGRLDAIWGQGTKGAKDLSKAVADISAAAAAHNSAIKHLEASMASTIASLKTQIATFGLSGTALDNEKVRLELVALGEGQLYDAYLKTKTALEEVLRKEQAHGDQLVALKKFYAEYTAEVNKLNAAVALEAAGKAADTAMQGGPKFGMDSLTPKPEVSKAFQDSYDELMVSINYSIKTWGMTADQVTRFNLAQADGSPLAKRMTDQIIAQQDKLQRLQIATATWGEFTRIADRSLNELIFSGKKFTQVLVDVTKALGEMFVKMALFGPPGGGGGQGIFGSIFKGLFGGLLVPSASFSDLSGLGMISPMPTFAGGGTVTSNTPIIVGERGPEIFMPPSAGTIVPSGSGAGSGAPTVNYYIDARGSSITEEQFRRSLQISEGRAIQNAIQISRELTLRTA